MKAIIVALCLVSSTVGYAFPENIRLGYAGCQSCHVAPTGGGVLTGYGRGASAEFMTSFQYQDEGRFLHNAVKKTIDFADVGGDVRYMRLAYEVPGSEPFERSFTMQADLELALHLSEELTIVGSFGKYGEKGVEEYRRHYILWNKNANFSVRLGRFFPAYGVMTSDHSLQIKKHMDFDQGRESYNAEFAIKGDRGEMFATVVLGKEGSLRLTRDKGYILSSAEKGITARGTLFVTDRSTVGVSGLALGNEQGGDTRAVGFFATGAVNENLYGLLQFDTKRVVQDKYAKPESTTAGWIKAGYQVLRGIHLYGQLETLSDVVGNTMYTGGGLQWFPRPHFELLGQIMTEKNSRTTMFIAHYYW